MDEIFRIINTLRYRNCNEFFNSLSPINYAVIKGEPLSIYAYGKPGQRKSSDIDILISRDDLKTVEQHLTNLGFQNSTLQRQDRILMLAASHQVAPWFKDVPPISHINIDLNFDVFWGEHLDKCINIGDFVSDAIFMDIYGVKIKTLSPFKTLIQLILHHYKEMNSLYHLTSHNCINHNMFKDVYFLWKNNKAEIPLLTLYEFCKDHRIIPYVYYVLFFTNKIFNDKELQAYSEAFKTTEGESLLDFYGLCPEERKEWKVSFETRLNAVNLFSLIKQDLTAKDYEKIKLNHRLFG